MNFIADGYLLEKHHSQRITEIEEKYRLATVVTRRQQKNSVVLKKTSAFFYQLNQLLKIRTPLVYTTDYSF